MRVLLSELKGPNGKSGRVRTIWIKPWGETAPRLGVVVEHFPPGPGVPEGYEIEIFSASGDTIAVVSVPATGVRRATDREVLSVRELART